MKMQDSTRDPQENPKGNRKKRQKKFIIFDVYRILDFPGGSDGKMSACNAGDLGLIPGLGRCPGEGNGNPLQHSRLENPMDGGA